MTILIELVRSGQKCPNFDEKSQFSSWWELRPIQENSSIFGYSSHPGKTHIFLHRGKLVYHQISVYNRASSSAVRDNKCKSFGTDVNAELSALGSGIASVPQLLQASVSQILH